MQTSSPTLARQEDGLGYIRIWVTPLRRLVFWDGTPSPFKCYQSHAPNLIMCERSPRVDGVVPDADADADADTSVVKSTVQRIKKGAGTQCSASPDSLFEEELLRFVQTNSLTLVRQGDGLGHIRIWVTPPKRLVFWDGTQSP